MSFFGSGASLFPSWLLRAAESGSTLLEGLVSYWPLDETAGTRYDAVGTNHLTDNNTVGAKLRGPEGTVASFVAANSEYLSSTFTFNADSPITFAGWVRFNSISGQYSLLHSGNYNFDIRLTNGYPQMFVNGSSVAVGGAASEQTVDEWHFWLAWYDPVEAKAYMQTDNGTVYSAAAAANGATTQTSLGRTNGVGGYWDGELASPALWTRVLTSDERLSLFNSGQGKRYADLTTDEKVGLVSYWNLDEQSGVRYDSHGSNDLADNNTVLSVINAGDAMDGAAASFVVANNEYLSRGTSTAFNLDPVNGTTLSMWFSSPSGATAYETLVADDDGGGATRNWFVGHEAVNQIRLYAWDAGGTPRPSALTAYTPDQWNLLCVWYDPADSKAYFSLNDGAPVATAALVGGPRTTGAAFNLGGTNGAYTLTGKIDEVAVWSRVLSEAERTELYNAGAGRFYNGSDFVE